jgi:hypothetical protein
LLLFATSSSAVMAIAFVLDLFRVSYNCCLASLVLFVLEMVLLLVILPTVMLIWLVPA